MGIDDLKKLFEKSPKIGEFDFGPDLAAPVQRQRGGPSAGGTRLAPSLPRVAGTAAVPTRVRILLRSPIRAVHQYAALASAHLCPKAAARWRCPPEYGPYCTRPPGWRIAGGTRFGLPCPPYPSCCTRVHLCTFSTVHNCTQLYTTCTQRVHNVYTSSNHSGL